jgi:hypothetical protein
MNAKLQPAIHRRLEIISGGQTAIGRGALDAALELGAQCGGYCPKGRLAEGGPIPARFPLRALQGADYEECTRRNVEQSDGTLILHFGPLGVGMLLTLRICAELGRPVRLADGDEASPRDAALQARHFVDAQDIQRLNVAESRAGHWPEAHDYAYTVVRELLLDCFLGMGHRVLPIRRSSSRHEPFGF